MTTKVKNLEISIDSESLSIYIERGLDKDPIHVCYWHLDEVEEDAEVCIPMLLAVQLYYTNQMELCKTMNVPQEFIIPKYKERKTWTVWVGGGEVNDSYLTHEQAMKLQSQYIDDGYDDVVIENVKHKS